MHRIRRLISPIAPTPLAPRAGLVLLLLIGGFLTLEARSAFSRDPLSHAMATANQDADSDLGNRFTPGQFPPDGTMWLRRYDRDSADGKRRAGTVYINVKNVTAAEITDAITRLEQTAPDASKGFAELEVKAAPSKSLRQGLFSYLFLGADPVRVRRVVQARDGFVYLEKADKKPGHIVIQRLARFTPELGLLPQGLSVQVWAGDVPAELVLEALTELMAMTPEAGVPQEVRRQIPPGSGMGNRISLDLVDTDPLKLWKELEAARKGQP